MTLAVYNRQSYARIPVKLVRRAVMHTLRLEKTRADIGICFVNNAAITRYNRRYLGRNRSTDVIAFSYKDSPRMTVRPDIVSGDIIISAEEADRSARALGTTFRAELMLLVVHGVLHVLGYTHNLSRDASRMRAREERILRHFGLSGIMRTL